MFGVAKFEKRNLPKTPLLFAVGFTNVACVRSTNNAK
jgi:hypothetical protein